MAILQTSQPHEPWNKGRLISQKAPLKLKDIWAIPIAIELDGATTATGRMRDPHDIHSSAAAQLVIKGSSAAHLAS